MKIFVKKLAYKTTEDTLRTQFEKFGEVSSVTIVMDLKAKRSKGFGFVEMPNQKEGKAAIKGLSKYKIDGKAIFVKEAGESVAPTPEKTYTPPVEKKTDRFEKGKKKDRFEKRKKTDRFEKGKKKDRFEKRDKTDPSKYGKKK